MASAATQESPDVPRLSLSVDHIASSSPFPSPGSPFIPPPRLSAHEFALRTPLQMRNNVHKKRASADQSSTTTASSTLSPTTAGTRNVDEDATPTTASMKTAFDRTGPSPPTTPTRSEAGPSPLTPPATPKITIPEPIASPDSDSIPDSARPTALNLQRNSLASSRPAPPSPALSRRTSAALSRRSSTRSRRASKLPVEASSSVAPTPAPVPVPAPEKKRRSILVKIRDFAFPRSDDRHIGRGTDVPRANRVRRSTASTSSSSSSASGIREDEPGVGWGSFHWNTLGAHIWPTDSGATRDADAAAPSQTDFARNFDASSPSEEVPDPYEDGDEQEYDEYVPPSEEGPLVPGLYKAMFAFEPEGTAEMALDEEQIVRIVGRGGGVGWAVVEKDDGSHALVPESYLELVQTDEEDD
ncbi:hypothetical protein FOMPIDRAFT_1060647 [Fomitopsis schrenkii]|uniref:SH3 domain-containing protein n=1 Tax=Fomitopsis schrenkii TaxID=2126942 RepID=S8E4X8_FOMSC|nr:hypothetical protein FOMPIDRAFT_1060647 [Fomitopsis schrenkii]